MGHFQTLISDLTIDEKLQLIEELWDDVCSNPEAIPLPDWQKEELLKRKAKFEQNPNSGKSWDEVKSKLRERYAG